MKTLAILTVMIALALLLAVVSVVPSKAQSPNAAITNILKEIAKEKKTVSPEEKAERARIKAERAKAAKERKAASLEKRRQMMNEKVCNVAAQLNKIQAALHDNANRLHSADDDNWREVMEAQSILDGVRERLTRTCGENRLDMLRVKMQTTSN